MMLGSFPDMSLAEAREERVRQRRLRDEGRDPIGTRKEKRGILRAKALHTKTFRQCAEEFLDDLGARLKPVTRSSWEAALRNHVYPKLGDLPVELITRREVLDVIRPLWRKPRRIAAKGGTPTAYLGLKTLQRIESIFDWWLAHGDGTRGNPARWKGQISKILPHPYEVRKLEHRPAIPYGELPAFYARVQEELAEPYWVVENMCRGGARPELGNLALQFVILTCVRAQEACGAKWNEIDWHAPVCPIWTVPGTRMKKKEEHKVPLSPAAVAVLRRAEQFKVSDFIFPSPGKVGHVRYQTVLRRTKTYYGDSWGRKDRLSAVPITTHGMRAAFSTWRAEKTNFPEELGEAALAHKIPSATKAAYQRGGLLEKRVALMCAWADFVTGAEEKGKVVQLRKHS